MKTKLIFSIVTLIVSFFSFGQINKSNSNLNQDLYSSLEYRLVGPFRGGRAGTAVGVANNSNLYYMGTAGGGVWKTEDSGNTWQSISDGFFGGSIGAIAVSESDTNIIYVGEGEQTLRGNVSSGHGLWKSNDAGETWNYIGLPKSEHISRIRIHPQDPNICLLYTSPSPRDVEESRMPSSA